MKNINPSSSIVFGDPGSCWALSARYDRLALLLNRDGSRRRQLHSHDTVFLTAKEKSALRAAISLVRLIRLTLLCGCKIRVRRAASHRMSGDCFHTLASDVSHTHGHQLGDYCKGYLTFFRRECLSGRHRFHGLEARRFSSNFCSSELISFLKQLSHTSIHLA